MATALEVITRALRRLKVYAAGEEIGSEDAEDCLTALNDMLFGWSINGIDIAHVALDLSDVLDVPDDHLKQSRSALPSGLHRSSRPRSRRLTRLSQTRAGRL
jgi:hypothetical protein